MDFPNDLRTKILCSPDTTTNSETMNSEFSPILSSNQIAFDKKRNKIGIQQTLIPYQIVYTRILS